MENTNYNIIAFPELRFDVFNLKPRDYSFFFVGKNLSKEKLNTGLEAINTGHLFNTLKAFFQENGIVSIGLSRKQRDSELNIEIELIKQKIDLKKSHFAVLIEYKNPNILRAQETLAAEESFMISPDEFIRYSVLCQS